MTSPSYPHVTQLGQRVAQPLRPDEAILERLANASPGSFYVIRLTCPEFTSLCPITAQPDFAHLVVDYVPKEWIVESKSFKLFLNSYRNHGTFHESCTLEIASRLRSALEPIWLRIGAYWYPRGGIPIDVFWQTGPAPANAWVPPLDVPPYRGRG